MIQMSDPNYIHHVTVLVVELISPRNVFPCSFLIYFPSLTQKTKNPCFGQVIGRMCKIIDKTCLSPTPTLEQHLMWDDIAILARYMLMLSFNNSLDVAAHLPYLFHVVTLLVATGPLSLRASTHGLVINIIHSLCTCSQLNFSGECLGLSPKHESAFYHVLNSNGIDIQK